MPSVADPDPITIRITARSPAPTIDAAARVAGQVSPKTDYRQEFWDRVKKVSANMQAAPSDQLETKLLREFGPKLKDKLVRYVKEPLETVGWLSDREFLSRIEHNVNVDDFRRAQLSELMEERKKRLANATLVSAFEKVAAAGSLILVVRIEGYQSLSLSVLIGSIDKLAQVFDGDAFNLKLFLGAFVGEAFGDVFGALVPDEFVFNANVPPSLAAEIAKRVPPTLRDPAGGEAEELTNVRERARHQARVAWRYATTTMLIPVLLALAVTYFAFEEMRSITSMRDKAFESTLDHQLQLLREDRLRMTRTADSSTRLVAPDTARRR